MERHCGAGGCEAAAAGGCRHANQVRPSGVRCEALTGMGHICGVADLSRGSCLIPCGGFVF